MDFSFNKLNLLRLSGIKIILGINLNKGGAEVVELKSYGGLLNKYRSKYKVINSFKIDFGKDQLPEENGGLIAKELKEKGIKTRFCVSSINSTTARTVTAEIPSDAEDVESWIKENYEKLIRVPVPLSELAFAYEILPAMESQTHQCKISFVREAERQEYVSFFSAAGLHLLHLGLNGGSTPDDPVINALCPKGYEGNPAVELAIKGFLPELSSMDFRGKSEKKKTTNEKDKTLFNRTVLAFGVVIFMLLGIQFGLNTYFQNESDKIDGQLLQVGPAYSEVTALNRQVSALRAELEGGNRSNISKVLHDIAEATPDGVWFYKLDIAKDKAGNETIDIFGYARTSELAASYLGALQEDKRFSNVQVVRVGAPTESEAVAFVNSGIKSVVTFELKMEKGEN